MGTAGRNLGETESNLPALSTLLIYYSLGIMLYYIPLKMLPNLLSRCPFLIYPSNTHQRYLEVDRYEQVDGYQLQADWYLQIGSHRD